MIPDHILSFTPLRYSRSYLERLSSSTHIKWIKHSLAHTFELHIRAKLYLRGDMESMYTELALYRSKNKCARTDNVVPISELCDGTVSLFIIATCDTIYY